MSSGELKRFLQGRQPKRLWKGTLRWVCRELSDEDQRIPLLSLTLKDLCPDAAGVYVVWADDNRPLYIGQARDLQSRIDGIRSSKHILGRKVAACLDYDLKSKKDQTLLEGFCESRLFFAYVELALGRCELEEALIHEWRRDLLNDHKLDKIPKRLRKRLRDMI